MSRLFLRSAVIDWDLVAPDSWLRDIPALARLTRLDFAAPVTFLAGENGTGKSTLLEALAAVSGFNPEGGNRNTVFSTYDDVSELREALRLVRGPLRPRSGYFFRAESFFNLASAIMTRFNDGSMPDYHARSHGESFLEYLQGTRGAGLFLMDEPEAALSPQRQLTLLYDMVRQAEGGSQFIVATHSPILLGTPGAQILSFDGGSIHPVAWEETESYRVTRLFLEHPRQVLRSLLEEEPPEA